MDDRRLGMAVRARRHRRGWRLVDLAAAAGVGPTSCSLLERGQSARLTVRTARAIATAVDLTLHWDPGWQRQEIDRLLDADHSALAARWSERLRSFGWTVRAEVSFNHYGDRGRIDLLGFHPTHSVLLVIELKTALVDAQALLGGLDVKARVAPFVAGNLGWRPRRTIRAVVMTDGTSARRHVAALGPLFAPFAIRGHAAIAWLRDPAADASGLLVFTKLPPSAGSDARRAGRRRVRLRRSHSRSDGPGVGAG